MITCPACGKENEDSAFECKRCRAPLREEEPPIEFQPEAGSLGEVCIRCEAYNEPGLTVCATAERRSRHKPLGNQPRTDSAGGVYHRPRRSRRPFPRSCGPLAISDEEAAERG